MIDRAIVLPVGVETKTTLLHVKEFLKQYNFPAETKEQILKVSWL